MVSKKMENLSDKDLTYLEKLLSKEFKRQCDESSVFRSKNHYARSPDTAIIQRLQEAVRSQKLIQRMEKW